MGKTEILDVERVAAYVTDVEGIVGSPVNETERAEAGRWFKLGAPAAHAAVSVKASRLIGKPAANDA